MIRKLILVLACIQGRGWGFAPSIRPPRRAKAASNPSFIATTSSSTRLLYRTAVERDGRSDDVSFDKSPSSSFDVDTAPISIDSGLFGEAMAVRNLHQRKTHKHHPRRSSSTPDEPDPSLVEFASSAEFRKETASDVIPPELLETGSEYPFALMMRGSAQYISAHAGETAVFHIPGEIIDDDKASNSLFSDMALAWLLGMKLVVVVGCRYDIDTCDMDLVNDPHTCHNSLRVTDADSLRQCEEEAGYLRTEVERKLNRYLRVNGGVTSTKDAPAPEGNVVSGNFYTAQRFGTIRGQDFEYTGYASDVHVDNINRILEDNDVVLLTTVGVSPLGELVNVNGYHLTAAVASALEAYKLIYMSNEGTVMRKKGESDAPLQDVPLSFAKAITEYHDVQVHNTGFATFEKAHETLPSGAVELLLHLGWGAWAIDNGVTRSHIVNPGDGAILEELFTSKNGANTCLYLDEEDEEAPVELLEEDWDDFFAASTPLASSQGGDNATFR